MLKKITEDLKKLKVATTEAEKAKKAAEKKAAAKAKPAKAKESKAKKAKADRPKSINACTKKTELMLFKVDELKEWLVAKKVEKLSGLRKEELVSKVLKKLKEKAADSDSSDSGSESEYTDCDTDSDCSDSDSD